MLKYIIFSGYVLFSDPLRPVNSREKLFSKLSPNPQEILHDFTSMDLEEYKNQGIAARKNMEVMII